MIIDLGWNRDSKHSGTVDISRILSETIYWLVREDNIDKHLYEPGDVEAGSGRSERYPEAELQARRFFQKILERKFTSEVSTRRLTVLLQTWPSEGVGVLKGRTWDCVHAPISVQQ